MKYNQIVKEITQLFNEISKELNIKYVGILGSILHPLYDKNDFDLLIILNEISNSVLYSLRKIAEVEIANFFSQSFPYKVEFKNSPIKPIADNFQVHFLIHTIDTSKLSSSFILYDRYKNHLDIYGFYPQELKVKKFDISNLLNEDYGIKSSIYSLTNGKMLIGSWINQKQLVFVKKWESFEKINTSIKNYYDYIFYWTVINLTRAMNSPFYNSSNNFYIIVKQIGYKYPEVISLLNFLLVRFESQNSIDQNIEYKEKLILFLTFLTNNLNTTT